VWHSCNVTAMFAPDSDIPGRDICQQIVLTFTFYKALINESSPVISCVLSPATTV
jgi:hypothetical protein